MMRKSLAAAAVAASLFAGGAAGAALFVPNLAGAQTDPPTTQQEQPPEPSQFLSDALKPLVDDGTITQEQADAVADALAKAGPPPGGHHGGGRGGHHLATVAGALGIDEAALRDELRSGKTIAQVASERGVDVQKVVDALVAEMDERLAADVASGRITQEQADQMKADKTERITAMVNGEAPPVDGRGGPGPWGPPRDGDPAGQGPSDQSGGTGSTATWRSGSSGVRSA